MPLLKPYGSSSSLLPCCSRKLMEVEQACQPGGPSWGELPADVVQAIFRCSLADDARAGVMGLATCRPWRAALAGAPLRRLVVTPDMLGTRARDNRVACWLSKQAANSHLGRLRELVLPAAVHDGMSPALRLALAGLPKEVGVGWQHGAQGSVLLGQPRCLSCSQPRG